MKKELIRQATPGGSMEKALSLVHVIREPSVPDGDSPPLLLLLHGLGSNEGDLIGLASELDGRFFSVSARAPYAMGGDSFAWFGVQFGPGEPVIQAEEAERSRLALLRFIDELVAAYGLDAARVYLLGFSQGAIMGLGLALTAPEEVAGVVAMSGRILPGILPLMAAPDRLRGLPIFIAHGKGDSVLPIAHGRAAREVLSRLPVHLDYREYEMGHEISDGSLGDIAGWLRDELEA
jgi:phospholipase/carboxylesterase